MTTNEKRIESSPCVTLHFIRRSHHVVSNHVMFPYIWWNSFFLYE